MAERGQSLVESNLVSVVALKDLAKRMLPPTSALRELILSEADFLPDEEMRIKVKVYSRLLYREMKGQSRVPSV